MKRPIDLDLSWLILVKTAHDDVFEAVDQNDFLMAVGMCFWQQCVICELARSLLA